MKDCGCKIVSAGDAYTEGVEIDSRACRYREVVARGGERRITNKSCNKVKENWDCVRFRSHSGDCSPFVIDLDSRISTQDRWEVVRRIQQYLKLEGLLFQEIQHTTNLSEELERERNRYKLDSKPASCTNGGTQWPQT